MPAVPIRDTGVAVLVLARLRLGGGLSRFCRKASFLRLAVSAQTEGKLDPRPSAGMTVEITIIVARFQNMLIIPVQARFQKEGETFAYVWGGSKFRRRNKRLR
jgi:hypothetical protein